MKSYNCIFLLVVASFFHFHTGLAAVTIDPRDIKPGTVNTQEFGALNGVTGNIQEQFNQSSNIYSYVTTRTSAWDQAILLLSILDTNVWKKTDTTLDFQGYSVLGGAPTLPAHLVPKSYVDSQIISISNVSFWAMFPAITNIVPAISNLYDLGSLAFPFRDIYLGGNSIYMLGQRVLWYDSLTTSLIAEVSLTSSGGVAYVTNPVAGSIISSDTQRWNTAYASANWSSGGVANVSNSWYGSIAFAITGTDTSNWNKWLSESNLYYLASNPNGFLSVETDPVFTNWLSTNAYIQIELDPIWASESNLYYLASNPGGYINAAYANNMATKTNFSNMVVDGDFNMRRFAITNIGSLVVASNNSVTAINGGIASGEVAGGGTVVADSGFAKGFASGALLQAKGVGSVAIGSAIGENLLAGQHQNHNCFALGYNVQATPTFGTAYPTFALGRNVTNRGVDSFIWSSGYAWTNTGAAVQKTFTVLAENGMRVLGNLTPVFSNAYDLGSLENPWQTVYVDNGCVVGGTNLLDLINTLTNTVILEMTNAVSFPNGIYLAGTYLDGTTGQLSIAYVSFDNDLIPTQSNAFDIGSLEYPVRDLYLGSNSVYMAGEKVFSSWGLATWASQSVVAVSGEVDVLQLQLPAVSNIAQAAYTTAEWASNGVPFVRGGDGWDFSFALFATNFYLAGVYSNHAYYMINDDPVRGDMYLFWETVDSTSRWWIAHVLGANDDMRQQTPSDLPFGQYEIYSEGAWIETEYIGQIVDMYGRVNPDAYSDVSGSSTTASWSAVSATSSGLVANATAAGNFTVAGDVVINNGALQVGRYFSGRFMLSRGIGGGYASSRTIMTSNDSCFAFGRASLGNIIAGGNITGPAVAMGNDVQAVGNHADYPTFAFGRSVSNTAYDSFVWSSGYPYTNNTIGSFGILATGGVYVVGDVTPVVSNAYDLGSLAKPWKALYITGTKSCTNTWLDKNDITNTQVFINGMLTSWTTNSSEVD